MGSQWSLTRDVDIFIIGSNDRENEGMGLKAICKGISILLDDAIQPEESEVRWGEMMTALAGWVVKDYSIKPERHM